MRFKGIHFFDGIIENRITTIANGAKCNKTSKILVKCNDNEIFDQAMQSLANKYENCVGLVLAPNFGCKQQARRSTVSIYNEYQDHTINLDIMIVEEYEKDKAAIDAISYDEKHVIAYTGC